MRLAQAAAASLFRCLRWFVMTSAMRAEVCGLQRIDNKKQEAQ